MFITIFNPRSIPSKEHNDEKNGFGLSPALYYRDVRLRRHALDGPETGGQTSCAGWNRIRIKPETAVYLVKNDFSAGIDIDSHNLNGQNNGCWK